MILRKDYRKDTNLFKNIVLYMMTRFGLIFWCILFFLNNKKLLESIEMTFFMVCLCIFIGYIPLYLEFRLNGGVDHKGLWEKQQLKKANELLLEGKSLTRALQEGYERAMTAIIDSNITTIISAVVLYVYGTGPIKGFAVTITVGILASMLTAILGTRGFYESILPNIKNGKKYFGLKG